MIKINSHQYYQFSKTRKEINEKDKQIMLKQIKINQSSNGLVVNNMNQSLKFVLSSSPKFSYSYKDQ